MKKFLVEVLLAFVMFALSISLLSTFSFFVATFPFVILAVLLICAVTEAFVSFSDKKWGFKWDWVVVLGMATITSLPFYPSFVFVVPIYMGAVGYYAGRRLCSRLH
ncbi:hypothetical protein CI793_04480 [Anoxybacillus ayderensis]|uniref:hypothetical protein n=1 Tax=Anoxybacillus sp. ST70 TaxID=2864180 RepID=UPI00037771E0|nr:hypothetical protein B379_05280 [Anoxybacillus ayderensis G10]MBW9219187.1 hypothetical protein [Anoxybacillus sp. ST70]THD17072.1 hypothetical protein CI793_04480 [Anoxybacillus ayderensis]